MWGHPCRSVAFLDTKLHPDRWLTLEEQGGVYGFCRSPAVGLSHPIKQLLGQFQMIEWLAAECPPVLQCLQLSGCGLRERLRVAHITVLQYPCAFRENQSPPDFLCIQQH